MKTSYRLRAALMLGLIGAVCTPARAIIVFQDPGRLTTMPTVGSVKPGWQYLGNYGAFTGIPIGPRAWVTAEHVTGRTIGSAGVLNYDNAGTSSASNYASTLAVISGDLAVMTLDSNQPSFTSWAPVWSDPNTLNVGTSVYMYGKGTERGSATTGGWTWGNAASTLSYGTNQVDTFAADLSNNVYIQMDFNQPNGSNNLPNTEGIFSTGDSGGGIFAFNSANARYELVGVNYGVDVVTQTPTGPNYLAALYNANGYYYNGQLISSPNPTPLSSYSTAIPYKYTIIAPFTVPEPGTWVMMILSTAGLFLARKRLV